MSIAAERLRPGQQILIQGKLTFGKLSEQYQGEALERRVAQQVKAGSLYPTRIPHTTVSIADAQVLPAEPNNPSLEEQYVQERTYVIKQGENQGKQGFSLDDKSKYLPPVFVKNEEGQYAPVKLERELASGLDVMLLVETYAPKEHQKRGLALRRILINEPIKYYGGASDAALAERGIVFAAPAERVPATGAAQGTSEASGQDEALPANTSIDPASGLAMPSPGVAPVAPVAVAPVAPVATTTVAPIPEPAPAPAPVPIEDKDARIAALEAALAQQNPTPQGQSAFDAAPAAPAPAGVGTDGPSPWDPR